MNIQRILSIIATTTSAIWMISILLSEGLNLKIFLISTTLFWMWMYDITQNELETTPFSTQENKQ